MTTTLDYVANESPVPATTLVELFFQGVDRFQDATAFESFVAERTLQGISYTEASGIAKAVAAALTVHGCTRGDRAAILSENRPEWALSDYGCLCAGVIDVPIYATLTAHQVGYVLENSGAKLVFVSTPEQLDKALDAASRCPQDVRFVVFDPPDELPPGAVSWHAFLESGAERAASWSEEEFRARARQARPEDVATVLYTSGTTGQPKGVMLTHNNVASNVVASCMVLEIADDDNTMSFLPLSHILQRMVDYLFFTTGCCIGYPASLPTLIEDMQVVRPTVVVSVPRIYEKIYNGVMEARGLKKSIIDWAVDVADRAVTLRLEGKTPAGVLAVQYALADKLVFTKIRAAVGGRLRFFVSGGGPLAPVLNRFFYSIGMTILEGYGLTETSPVTNVNTLEDFRIGTVGKPIPGTEIRIAEDGEILVRGPQVMKGYYDDPEATAEVLDAEGWFATGDIGEIDADGFLSITDRKKDLIVTAGGKNVAPQPIENRLKTNPFVEQVVMIGDRRRYCSLLVVPAFDALERWAKEHGISWTSREELLRDREVIAHMEDELFGMLGDLASYEKPKKLALLPEELTIENGFLTPTLKVKRRVVQEKLEDVIDDLYADEAADSTAT
jgi:long-chain acyl-CoA synthetase